VRVCLKCLLEALTIQVLRAISRIRQDLVMAVLRFLTLSSILTQKVDPTALRLVVDLRLIPYFIVLTHLILALLSLPWVRIWAGLDTRPLKVWEANFLR